MKAIIYTLLMFTVLAAKGQDLGTRNRQFFAMDVITGGLIGGIGSAIHPKENQTRGNAFLVGFAKGCVGGSLTYAGKNLAFHVGSKKSMWYGWPAKLIHAGGSSIIENAAQNNLWYSNWAMDIGLLRVDGNMNGKFRFRGQPFAAIGFIQHIAEGSQFSTKRTIQTGTAYFYKEKTIISKTASVGRTYINSISVDETRINTFRYTAGHEMIHAFQERELLSINYFYAKNKQRFIYFDIPVFDTNYLVADILSNGKHYENWYENQAHTLANRKFVE